MNRVKYLFGLAVISLLLTTCQKNEQQETRQIEYMIFGHYYGKCAGEECIEFFKINCCHIMEDTMDGYPDVGLLFTGSFVDIDPKERDSVSFLIHRIPRVLFLETTKVFGQPDAGDWGGLYVEIKCVDQPLQFWYIDQMKSNIPTYLHPFVDDINKAIKLLK